MELTSTSPPISRKFVFPMMDFDKVLKDETEFSLPASILTQEIIAARSSRPITRSQRWGGKIKTYNRYDSSDEEGAFLNRSNHYPKPYTNGVRQKATSSAAQQKLNHSYRPYNRRGSKTKNNNLKIDDNQIATWTEQPPLDPWDAKAFVQTPFLRQTTPSSLVKGPFKLESKKIEEKFLKACFSSHVDAWLRAAEYLEDNNVRA